MILSSKKTEELINIFNSRYNSPYNKQNITFNIKPLTAEEEYKYVVSKSDFSVNNDTITININFNPDIDIVTKNQAIVTEMITQLYLINNPKVKKSIPKDKLAKIERKSTNANGLSKLYKYLSKDKSELFSHLLYQEITSNDLNQQLQEAQDSPLQEAKDSTSQETQDSTSQEAPDSTSQEAPDSPSQEVPIRKPPTPAPRTKPQTPTPAPRTILNTNSPAPRKIFFKSNDLNPSLQEAKDLTSQEVPITKSPTPDPRTTLNKNSPAPITIYSIDS